jgi:DNA-directed RNA polymerase specialized sigma24 family protein
MTFEEWVARHQSMLQRVSIRYAGAFWWEDLQQRILLKIWRAWNRKGDQTRFMTGRIIRNCIIDFYRFQKRAINNTLPLEQDMVFPSRHSIDWQTLFDLGHSTKNLTAVRCMRSVLNPDINQMQREQLSGGFSWNSVYETVGVQRKDMQSSFQQLKKDYESQVGELPAFFQEEA